MRNEAQEHTRTPARKHGIMPEKSSNSKLWHHAILNRPEK
jgi:hypothetical protein